MGDSYRFITCGGRQQLSSKCMSLPQNAGDLVVLNNSIQVSKSITDNQANLFINIIATCASSFFGIREHQQKPFVTLSKFWLLRGWVGLSESIRKGKFIKKYFFR